jgi:hypothetical protein
MQNIATNGQGIAPRRLAVGLTQVRLAMLARMSVFALNRVERGQRELQPDERERLDKVLREYEGAQQRIHSQLSASGAFRGA